MSMQFKYGLPEGVAKGESSSMLELRAVGGALSIALIALLAGIAHWVNPALSVRVWTYPAEMASVFPVDPLYISFGILFLLMPVHELAHALFANKDKLVLGVVPKSLLCYAAPYGDYSKPHALLIALAPTLLLTVLPLIAALALPFGALSAWLLLIAISHSFGCGGDIWACWAILKQPTSHVQYNGQSSDLGWAPATL